MFGGGMVLPIVIIKNFQNALKSKEEPKEKNEKNFEKSIDKDK